MHEPSEVEQKHRATAIKQAAQALLDRIRIEEFRAGGAGTKREYVTIFIDRLDAERRQLEELLRG